MLFKMVNLYMKNKSHIFSEKNAPDWLTGAQAVSGSTMDNSWFWNNHVLTLKVGESIDTDFQRIERIE